MCAIKPQKVIRKTPLDNDEWLINPEFLDLVKCATEYNSIGAVNIDIADVEEIIIVLSNMGYIILGDHVDETA